MFHEFIYEFGCTKVPDVCMLYSHCLPNYYSEGTTRHLTVLISAYDMTWAAL